MNKLICKFFVLLGLLVIGTTQAFAAEYTDLNKDHWAYKQIEALSEQGVVVGYPDKSFHPDENVTRAEFATMVIKAVGQENADLKEIINFDDINTDFWAWNMIQRAVRFDIIKRSPDNCFHPEADVTRAQAMAFVTNALETGNITEEQAKMTLAKTYKDYKTTPDWVIIIAGKAEILGVIAKVPGQENILAAERPATRAELAVFLYNLREQVQINANKKLREAMKPKSAEGIIIENAIVEGNIGTIPAGTILPVIMSNSVSSQKSKLAEVFVTKTPKNFVTKEKYLLIVEDSPIAGQVLDVKVGRYFIRNGKIILETKSIKTPTNQVANFRALANTDLVYKNFWQKFLHTVFKGAKVNIEKGKVVDIQLLQPIKVNMSTGIIIEDKK
ncbi:MAG: S-layer homology domain-containing protein [Candidatus Gastranaerophilales bacterium]|nr:S-layer homology domain-containing protein [Candidatus Gastranaerophilales bacterium]